MRDTTPHTASQDDFERLLFGSAHRDAVPETSRERVARALGLVPIAPLGAATGTTAHESGSVASGSVAAGAIASGSVASGSATAGSTAQVPGQLALLPKVLLVGAAGGVLVLSLVLGLRSGTRAESPGAARAIEAPVAPAALTSAPPAPPLEVAAAASAAVAVAAEPVAVELVAAEPPVETVPAAASVASVAPESSTKRAPHVRRAASSRAGHVERSLPAGATPPDAESRLLAEVRLLDEARNALEAEQPDRARSALARYTEQFPDGTLALDAAVLEVRALARAGQAARAQRAALRLLSRTESERYRTELEAFAHPLASRPNTRIRAGAPQH